MNTGLSWFRILHIYLGSILLIPILVIVTTGLILVGQDFFRYSHEPYQIRDSIIWDTSYLENALAQMDEMKLKDQIDSIYFPSSPSRSLRIRTTRTHANEGRQYFIHPSTSEILAETNLDESDFIDWVYKIHRGSWGGIQGKATMSILAIFIALLWPIGWIYRRIRIRKRSLNISIGQLKIPIIFHRTVGNLFGGILTLMSISGAMINFNKDLIRIFDPIPDSSNTSDFSARKRIDSITTSRLISIAKAHPESQIESIHLHAVPSPLILFYFKDNSRIYFNSHSLQIEKMMTPQNHWIHSLYPIHSGKIFGSVQAIYIILIGIFTVLILAAGLLSTRQGRKWAQAIRRFITVSAHQTPTLENRQSHLGS